MRPEILIFAAASIMMLTAVVLFVVFAVPDIIEQNERIARANELLEDCDCFGAKQILFKLPEVAEDGGRRTENVSI